ncbi:hypothetical protein [Geobacillus jurassicus]|uniref:hypothetical protein n=1 Tax=Geobacillus jurassicus TaxID=235932 RepID=UPI003641F777
MLDERWLMFYVAIYMYGIWDSYRGSVDMNKLYLLGSIYGYVLAWGANHLGHYRSGGRHRARAFAEVVAQSKNGAPPTP